MRVFTDSNFLISALATRGISADLFELLMVSSEIVYSQLVEDELLEKLRLKFKYPNEGLDEVGEFLKGFIKTETPITFPYSLRDKDDEPILAAAIFSKSDYLITGDKDLLSVRDTIKEVKIVSPREMWGIVNS